MNEESSAELTVQGGVLVVRCATEFDSDAVSGIRSKLVEKIQSHPQDIVFDFAETTFIDSSGIGLCVFCYKKLSSAGHRVGIAGLNGQPKSIIELSHIDKTVPLFDDVDQFVSNAD